MINNSITFYPGYFIYFSASLSLKLLKLEKIKIIPKVKNKYINLHHILKKKG